MPLIAMLVFAVSCDEGSEDIGSILVGIGGNTPPQTYGISYVGLGKTFSDLVPRELAQV
ncbi:MAG: hypothetical protein LBH18_03650 [Spirochaetaceae bacterium]|nr:hypothetical protein [Spirochaetaceae bacterium]